MGEIRNTLLDFESVDAYSLGKPRFTEGSTVKKNN
jgi:hypothetical protein